MISETKVDELRKELEEVGLEASMNYTLADAIREGSTVTDQCVGRWDAKEGAEVCALSAAMLALKARHLA